MVNEVSLKIEELEMFYKTNEGSKINFKVVINNIYILCFIIFTNINTIL